MAHLRLSAINLNLLPALDAVLQERHVTRAAARLGVTQSAMSYTLRQLRDLLDDSLLVRGPQGMVRTARGEELAPSPCRPRGHGAGTCAGSLRAEHRHTRVLDRNRGLYLLHDRPTAAGDQLADQGLERQIVMQLPSFPLALTTARATDLIFSAPGRFLRSDYAAMGLQVLNHPLVSTTFPVWMVWHERSERDPANQWLREQVVEAVRA